MEGSHEFSKNLRPSHVTGRKLDCPTGLLRFLPFGGQRIARFQATYGNEAVLRTFHCVLRNGRYDKPTICKGWPKLLDDKGLQAGDQLTFYVQVDENNLAIRFRIQAFRLRPLMLYDPNFGTVWDLIP